MNRKLALILTLAFFLRLLLPLASWSLNHDLNLFWSADTYSYVMPAKNLLETGHYSSENGTPEIYRPPGYPLLLIPGMALNHLESLTISLQIILSTLTVLFVYKLAIVIFNNQMTGLVASFLYAIEPLSLNFCSLLLSETQFTFLLAISVYSLVKWHRTHELSWLVLAGGGFSLCALIRPIAYFLPFAIAFWIVVACYLESTPRTIMSRYVAIFILVSMTPLLAWQLRNGLTTNYYGFSVVSDLGGQLYYQAEAVLARQRGIALDQQTTDRKELYKKYPEFNSLSPNQKNEILKKEAFKIIEDNPHTYLKCQIYAVFNTLCGPGMSSWWKLILPNVSVNHSALVRALKNPVQFQQTGRMEKIYVALELMILSYLIFILVFFIIGLFFDKALLSVALLFMGICAYFIVLPTVSGYSRYRHPIMPLIVVFSANGLACSVRLFSRYCLSRS